MFRMELQILLPVISVLSSGVFHTGAVTLFPVEASATPSSERHSRTKRCSCATFLDKECVYFCHLDIIWVNTPERTVSYGLGNVARRKRSVAQAAGSELERCRCANNNDGTCAKFCHTDYPPRHKATPDKVIPPACGPDCAEKESKHDMAAQAQSVKRAWKSAAESSAAVRRIRLLLKKWRLRRLHKAQATWRQK